MMSFLTSMLRAVIQKPATRPYPLAPRPPFASARGHLDMDPNACVYCGMCQRRCPTGAITVTRTPKAWTLNPHRCILCAYCVEVCPKHCMFMKPDHRPPSA